jgi:hypothetical protein
MKNIIFTIVLCLTSYNLFGQWVRKDLDSNISVNVPLNLMPNNNSESVNSLTYQGKFGIITVSALDNLKQASTIVDISTPEDLKNYYIGCIKGMLSANSKILDRNTFTLRNISGTYIEYEYSPANDTNKITIASKVLFLKNKTYIITYSYVGAVNDFILKERGEFLNSITIANHITADSQYNTKKDRLYTSENLYGKIGFFLILAGIIGGVLFFTRKRNSQTKTGN